MHTHGNDVAAHDVKEMKKKYGKEKHVSLRGFGGACISLGVKGNLDWKKKLKTNVYILMGKKNLLLKNEIKKT